MRSDAQLRDFLLGMLNDEEIRSMGDAAIVDDDVAERLAILEEDLIDAYARGELDDDARSRLEATILSTDYGQEQLAVARTLIARIERDSAAAPTPAADPPRAESIASIGDARRARHARPDVGRPRSTWIRTVAIAATILVVLAAVYLWRAADSQPPGVDPATLVVALVPAVRAADTVPTATLVSAIQTLRLEVDLEGVTSGRLDARLVGPAGDERFRLENVQPILVGGLPALIVEVPTAVLDHGRHVLYLDRAETSVGQFTVDIATPDRR